MQGYPDLEYIVLDAGSDDGSVDIIRHYHDFITYWRSEPDEGQAAALRDGFARGTGQIFGWVNSDDFLLSNALCLIVALRAAQPDCVAWIGACQELDEHDRPLRLRPPRVAPDKSETGDWSGLSCFYQPSVFFDAEAYRQVGEINPNYHNCMDVDLWVRLSDVGAFTTTQDVLSAARLYPDAKTFRDVPKRECELIAINVRHGRMQTACRRLGRLMHQGSYQPLPRQPFLDVADRVSLGTVLRYTLRRLLRGKRVHRYQNEDEAGVT
jgi:glycosyltransferase involved in cell wall biosynthesis